ncbi:TetR/AcrR family transcriptional regulator [Undibacterium baiyunense]|uniref:TetR/AcrR family transcriptional regulator n=1 Tax=Undibacterium baiyunense TaxID=2828731 RepID=A0A941DIJ4_9BURK|nr:TetR/AcrR family transcriptional regulator [Undibacterium baiyunense]MBR7746877.1 TetR/AcrR family transcriptional regulator [Undibacterium baiyunense]
MQTSSIPSSHQQSAQQDTRERILSTGQALILGKGFSALGLSEILSAAAVPKGSFYHYFQSKEGFGVAMLERYFADYQIRTNQILLNEAVPARERLINYFAVWQQQAESSACHKLCLAVKLAAEVSDLSEAMRLALTAGMQGITQKIAVVLQEVQRDGHVSAEVNTAELAEFLYATWVGASLLSKVHLQMRPMEVAMQQTKKILGV